MSVKIKGSSIVVFILLFTFAAHGQQMVIPIVQGSYLLGGTQGSKWITSEEAVKDRGKTITLRSIEIDSTDSKSVTGRTGEEWDACPGQAIVRIDGEENSDKMPGLFIGSGATWNPSPRKPVKIRTDSEAYIQVVRAYLRGKGIRRSPVKLTQIIEIDLDGDGTKEALISGTYYRKAMDLSLGDYSFTIIRYGKGDLAKNLLVDGQFLSRSIEFDLADHSVAAVADVNGDGRMEIALSVTHSESDEQMLFEYNAGKLEKRFEATCGA